jgi:hypothetical protein
MDLDDIADSISDDATMKDLVSGEEIAVNEVPEPEPPPAELAEADYDLDEPSVDSEEIEVDGVPELVERDWYGKKIKLDKDGDEYLNSYFTRKNQEIAEERRKAQEEATKALEEAQKMRDEVERQQRMLQSHLDANPEFAESWNYEQKVAERNTAFEKMQKDFYAMQERLQAQESQRLFEAEVNAAQQQYALNEGSSISVRDATDLALSQVITSDGAVSFTQAWQDVVGRYNRQVKSDGIAKVKNALENKAKTQGLTSKKSAQARTRPGKKKSIDELLASHLAMPEERFR